MHVSVRGERPGTSASEYLTTVESTFLAGLMHYLPSVIALTLPLSASYTRMVDGIWSGGTWVCWGVDNREAPVRLTKASSPSSRNFEVRPIDGTSNPYLAVAGVLACGILGVRDDLALAVKNCDLPRTAAEMSVAERDALGITKRLPLNIDEARRYLAADETIKDILGVELVETFLNINGVGMAFMSMIVSLVADRTLRCLEKSSIIAMGSQSLELLHVSSRTIEHGIGKCI